MKKVFVPKGETVSHNLLYTDKLIVKGTLRVSGKIVAREILGGGVIEAREIVCDNLHAYSVTADFITAARIMASKLFVRFECRASERIAVTDYVGAGYISTGKLSMTLSDIHSFDADEIITLRQKRRGLLGLLWASWWRGLFLEISHGGEKKPARQETESVPPSAPKMEEDMTGLVADILTTLKEQGYQISKAQAVNAQENTETAA